MDKKKVLVAIALSLVLLRIIYQVAPLRNFEEEPTLEEQYIQLPEPIRDSETSVEEALEGRRSVRDYAEEKLLLEDVSQLTWAAQGVTDDRGYRTAPSAGATYPLELYVAVGSEGIENLSTGVYRYLPEKHAINKTSKEDVRGELVEAAHGQSFIGDAPVVFVFVADYERTTEAYGERGKRYVKMEVGHAAQNIYLQAETRNLGTVVVGAFTDDEVKEILDTQKDPLYIVPVGKTY